MVLAVKRNDVIIYRKEFWKMKSQTHWIQTCFGCFYDYFKYGKTSSEKELVFNAINDIGVKQIAAYKISGL